MPFPVVGSEDGMRRMGVRERMNEDCARIRGGVKSRHSAKHMEPHTASFTPLKHTGRDKYSAERSRSMDNGSLKLKLNALQWLSLVETRKWSMKRDVEEPYFQAGNCTALGVLSL